VKSVAVQVNQKLGQGSEAKAVNAEYQKKADLKAAEEEKALIASLFKSVTAVKQVEAAEGEDAKSILCAFFKAGTCQKGRKCKYSHDLGIENKNAKIDLYTDQRAAGAEAPNMETWDNDTLQKAVEQNQRQYKNQKPTEIICKYFLDAVENSKYGWFWTCPNGPSCIYRHCLPPGYVLKKDIPKNDKDDELCIEELVEEERAKLSSKGTPVTLERFLEWKEKKRIQREVEDAKKVEEAKKHSKGVNLLSGRALFSFDPTMFADDDDAVDGEAYDEREEEGQEEEEGERKYNIDEQGEDDEEEKEEEDGEEQNDYQQLEEDNGEQNDENDGQVEQIKIQADNDHLTEVTATKNGLSEESKDITVEAEKKKKKKNKNKANKKTEDASVKINEDVFLDGDADLPDDFE